MTTPFVQLERRFTPIEANSAFSIADGAHAFGMSRDLGWADLLARRRVVILAEASAGKTREMREQRDGLAADGNFAFFATIEGLAAGGLDPLLGRADAASFARWLASDEEAWFLLDSVDEARINRKDVETALNRFAREIDAGYDRARVVVSCRGSVWDGEDDLALIRRTLGTTTPPAEPVDADDALFELGSDRAKVPASAAAAPDVTVVALAPLNAAQRATYLTQSKVVDVERFEEELFRRNLRQFAERPGDLAMLVGYWLAHRRFDGLLEMTELGVATRIEETNRNRTDLSELTREAVRAGAERLAAAMTLGRTMDVRRPDAADGTGRVDPRIVLSDWPAPEVEALLHRGLFVPSTFGLVRFFHRSAQEYLTARWFARMGERLTDAEMLGVFEGEAFGVTTVPPSLRAAAAWLALDRPTLRSRILDREPIVLLQHGDPARLALGEKERLLAEFARRQGAGEMAYARIDGRSLWMFAQPELAPAIDAAMAANPDRDFRYDMLTLIEQGRIAGCRDHVRAAATDPAIYRSSRIVAARALAAIGDEEGLHLLAASLLEHPEALDAVVAPHLVEPLFPRHLSVEQLLALIAGTPPAREYHTEGFARELPSLLARCGTPAGRGAFLAGVADLATVTPLGDWPAVSARHRKLLEGAGPLALAAIQTSDDAEHPDAVVRLLQIAEAVGADRTGAEDPGLEQVVPARPDLNRRLFLADVRLSLTQDWGSGAPTIHRAFVGMRTFWRLTADDRPWLEAQLAAADCREAAVALSALLWIAGTMPAAEVETEYSRLKNLVAHDEALTRSMAAERRGPADSEQLAEWRIRDAERKRDVEAAEERRRGGLIALRSRLQADPETLRDPALLATTFGFRDLHALTKWLARTAATSTAEGVRHRAKIADAFGPAVAAAYDEGMRTIWRVTEPEAPAVDADGMRTIKYALILSEAGLALEAETPGWAAALPSDMAERAVRHACIDDLGIPAWLGDVIGAHPVLATPQLLLSLDEEWSTPSRAHRPLLERLAHAFPITAGVRTALLERIASTDGGRPEAADITASIIRRLELDDGEREALCGLLDERVATFLAGRHVDAVVSALAALFALAPDRAAETLGRCLGSERRRRGKSRASRMLRGLFGRHRGAVGNLEAVPPDRLAGIVREAYRERARSVGKERDDDDDDDDGRSMTASTRWAAPP